MAVQSAPIPDGRRRTGRSRLLSENEIKPKLTMGGGTRVDRVGNPINLEAPVLSRYERRKINNFVAACSVTFPRRGGRRSLISRRNPRLRPPFLFLFVCNLDWNKILSTVKRNRILGCNKKIFNSRGLKYWKVRRVEGNIQRIFP